METHFLFTAVGCFGSLLSSTHFLYMSNCLFAKFSSRTHNSHISQKSHQDKEQTSLLWPSSISLQSLLFLRLFLFKFSGFLQIRCFIFNLYCHLLGESCPSAHEGMTQSSVINFTNAANTRNWLVSYQEIPLPKSRFNSEKLLFIQTFSVG